MADQNRLDPSGPDPLDAIATVTVAPASATIDVGSSTQLTATVRNGHNELVNTTVAWSSSSPGTATVTSSGLVKGVSEGSAAITATAGGRSGSSQINVEDPFPPAQPSNVVAVPASDTEMDVTWTDNSNNEDEFRIEREEAVGGAASSARGPSAQDFQHTGTVGPNVTEFHDTDLEAEKTYHYHVIACNQNDCSTPSPVP